MFLYLLGGNDYMAYYGYPVIVSDELKEYADFADIKAGDPIENVEAVDPLTSIYIRVIFGKMKVNKLAVENLAKIGTPVTSVHYLKDGMLLIEYSMPEEQKLVVSGIRYSADRVFKDCLGDPVDYTIVDCDLP